MKPSTATELPSQVFISYSHRDKEYVESLALALRAQNLTVWVDWHDISPGTRWKDEISKGIEKSELFLFVISPDSVSSYWCHRELAHANEQHVRILPIKYREVVMSSLSTVAYDSKLSEQEKRHWQQVIDKQRQEITDHIQWISGAVLTDTVDDIIKTVQRDPNYSKQHRRYRERALEWESHKSQSPWRYTLTGGEIVEARAFLERGKTQLLESPTDLQRAFIEASGKFRRFLLYLSVVLVFGLVAALVGVGIFNIYATQTQFDNLILDSGTHLAGPTEGDWIGAALGACQALSMNEQVQALDPRAPTFGPADCPINVRYAVGDVKVNDASFLVGRSCMALGNLTCAEGMYREILKNPVLTLPQSEYNVLNNLSLTLIASKRWDEAEAIIAKMVGHPAVDTQISINDVARLRGKLAYDQANHSKAKSFLVPLWDSIAGTQYTYREEVAFHLAMIYRAEGECAVADDFWKRFNATQSPAERRPNFMETERRKIATEVQKVCPPR